jgi:beta-lactam-binding protein with PASTA domain
VSFCFSTAHPTPAHPSPPPPRASGALILTKSGAELVIIGIYSLNLQLKLIRSCFLSHFYMTNNASKISVFRAKHPILSTVIAIGIVTMVLIFLCLMFLDVWTMHGRTSVVPQVKNLSFTEAKFALEDAHLDIEISDSIYDKTLAPGMVVESWPKAGAVVKRGRQVYVTINAFSPKQVTLSKPITGVSSRQAITYLQALGITAISEKYVPSQFDDLVERATVNGRPLGVGSIIAVNSIVTLEIGSTASYERQAMAADTLSVDDSEDDALDAAINAAIEEDEPENPIYE